MSSSCRLLRRSRAGAVRARGDVGVAEGVGWVARWHVAGITDGSVMMFDFPAMQLHHERAGMGDATGRNAGVCIDITGSERDSG